MTASGVTAIVAVWDAVRAGVLESDATTVNVTVPKTLGLKIPLIVYPYELLLSVAGVTATPVKPAGKLGVIL